MLHWIPYAFVRIVLSFIAGILLAIHIPDAFSEPLVVGVLIALTLLFFSFVALNYRYRKVVVNPGITGLVVIFLSGYLNTLLHDESRNADHVLLTNDISFYQGVMIAAPEEKERSWKQVLSIERVRTNATWQSASGKVLIYYPKHINPFHYGDKILVQGKPVPIPGPGNPGEFDYQRFLSFKNIFQQHFIQQNAFQFISHAPSNAFISFAIKTRTWAQKKLNDVIAGKQEKAIASALILGNTATLDREITTAYAATGSMHVLAVSGLHVGIIYMILNFIFRPLKKMKGGKWLITLLCVSILWSYACVTGLSPSVLRAVTMFSFVALAQTLNHRTNIYNTLAASAFCLLLFNPFLLMSVGFQLSYLAVIGIVYLQPLLYQLFEPSSRVVDEIWKISSVSIAAQLATFSIGLLYFHQFPNFFLVSNLFVIPLAFLILLGGLSVLALSWLGGIAKGLGYLLEAIIKLLNFLIFQLEGLPYALIENASVTVTQCLMLIGLVCFTTLFLQSRRRLYLHGIFLLLFLFSADLWLNHLHTFSKNKLVVYRISGHSAFEIISRGQAYQFCDSALLYGNSEKIRFHIQPNRLASGVSGIWNGKERSFSKEVAGGRFTCWNGKTILQLYAFSGLSSELKVDFLILSANTAKYLPGILEKINASKIILDSSNSYFVADKVLNSLPSKDQIHSVWHHGAFETNL